MRKYGKPPLVGKVLQELLFRDQHLALEHAGRQSRHQAQDHRFTALVLDGHLAAQWQAQDPLCGVAIADHGNDFGALIVLAEVLTQQRPGIGHIFVAVADLGKREATLIDLGLRYAEDARFTGLVEIQATGVVAWAQAEPHDAGVSQEVFDVFRQAQVKAAVGAGQVHL